MLAPVTDAIQRFRRRLRLATLVRAVSVATFAAMVVVAGVLLLERFAATQILAGWPWWGVWCGIAVVGLGAGLVLMRRTAFDDATVAQHLEQRLATNGLLLTASQGVALHASYQRQLTQRLAHTDTVLPVIRWRHLLMRPIAAAVLVIVVQYLPTEVTKHSSNEALEVAVERLKDEVAQVAQLEGVPGGQADELRAAVAELEQRVATGDNGLWREIDQLQERIDREEKLAAGDDGGAGEPSGAQQPFDRKQLADAMSKLGKMDKQGELNGALLDKVMDALPESIDDAARQSIAEAMQEDGSVAPEALPEDPEALAALSEALADTVEQLSGESAALAEMAAGMSAEQVGEMADELAALAEQFDADPPGLEKREEQLKADISEDLAKTAAEMAKAGALDQLPEGLREAMVEAGLSALENMDLQKLMSLLPEDLSQLTVMAENLAKAAEGLSGEQGSQAGESRGPQPSEALKKKMGELAKGLMEKVGRQAGQMQSQPGGMQPGDMQPGGGQQSGGQQSGGQQSGGQQSGGQQPGGRQPGAGTVGGGHAALRLTEDTQGGLGKVDVELPGRDPDDLPKEWVPVTIEKAKPEVGDGHAPGVGRAGATGRGTATWQLRLMPRHRDVVRRFFAEKNKKNK